jgi:hypothetical protein
MYCLTGILRLARKEREAEEIRERDRKTGFM